MDNAENYTARVHFSNFRERTPTPPRGGVGITALMPYATVQRIEIIDTFHLILPVIPRPPIYPTPPGNPPVRERAFMMERGDIILTVNGEHITGRESLTAAVNRSPQTMYFTVRDRRNGQIRHFRTTLASSGHRFGIYAADNPGGGARIVQVMPNSAATHCILVE